MCGLFVFRGAVALWSLYARPVQEPPNQQNAESNSASLHQLDYELDAEVIADRPDQIRAVAEPTRARILDLVLERSATVTELASALGRPKSSVAHHVAVLHDAGLLKVVRTRKVRAIEERFYGRVARCVKIGRGQLPDGSRPSTFIEQAASELSEFGDHDLLATIRHARIPAERAAEFFDRVAELADEFTRLPREGDVVYGFVAGVYPTDQPVLDQG